MTTIQRAATAVEGRRDLRSGMENWQNRNWHKVTISISFMAKLVQFYAALVVWISFKKILKTKNSFIPSPIHVCSSLRLTSSGGQIRCCFSKQKLLSPTPCGTLEIEAVVGFSVCYFVFNLDTSVHLAANWFGLFRSSVAKGDASSSPA